MAGSEQNHASADENLRLSEHDLELISALQIAPRVSWQDAGAILGAHPATLAARWERIRAAGLAWITAYSVGDPATMNLAFVNVDCDPGRADEVADALCAMPEVQSVELPAGHHDLLLTVFTETLPDYALRVAPAIRAVPGVVRIHSSLGTRLHQAGHAWRLAALGAKQAAAFAEVAEARHAEGVLPATCRDLLPLLARDGRASAAEMARALGRNPSTVQRQLTRILGSGLVSFRCDVAQIAVGFPVNCTWYARVPPGEHAAAAAALRSLRSVRLAASVTGPANFIVTMWLHSVAEVMGAELALQERVPGIEITESLVMLRVAKRMGILLGPDGRSLGTPAAGRTPATHDGVDRLPLDAP
ncbi:Lrp/AsnC ligand binding domain-containing protein [Sinomonas mesophila]|uniref:Lrp/AsnC ligand binding domain-containing protein n=1 Tax=Sinomonas mesophila TaxID=1531955 RepID=UPI0009871C71